MGLGKSFDLPWEGQKFQFRWEAFNVANTQKMGGVANYAVDQSSSQAQSNWASFTSIQGTPHSVQFVLRYSF